MFEGCQDLNVHFMIPSGRARTLPLYFQGPESWSRDFRCRFHIVDRRFGHFPPLRCWWDASTGQPSYGGWPRGSPFVAETAGGYCSFSFVGASSSKAGARPKFWVGMEFRQQVRVGSQQASKSELGFEIVTPRLTWGQIPMAVGVTVDVFRTNINETLSLFRHTPGPAELKTLWAGVPHGRIVFAGSSRRHIRDGFKKNDLHKTLIFI